MMRQDAHYRSLEVCLQRLRAGEGLEQVLGAYPRWASEFRPILQAAQVAQVYADSIRVSTNAQSQSRAAFLEAASEMIPRRTPVRRKRRARSGLLLLVLIAALTLAAVQLIGLSSETLPGDWLYPLKLLEERVRLSLAADTAERLSLEFEYNQQRVREIEALLREGRIEDVQFSSELREMGLGEWQVGEIRVLIPPDTRVVGKIQPGFYVTVHGQTQPEGGVAARQVQMQDYIIAGQLEELSVGRLVVDGVHIVTTTDTIVRGAPEVGRTVQVIALRSLRGDLHARLLEIIAEH